MLRMIMRRKTRMPRAQIITTAKQLRKQQLERSVEAMLQTTKVQLRLLFITKMQRIIHLPKR